ncbi:CGEA protein [Gottfriedia acidiceleris]|uniref:CGEA protein n=1 Tax=Gottfriedia acidiceleris TaxID=371036 RepID=UPI000B43258C|nr:CGEA protein [Gottfriedia acidiceleris]
MSSFRHLIENLIPGQVIVITTDSGDTIGPAQFVTFNNETGIIILKEFSSLSPSDEVVVTLIASKIESIRFH